VKKLIGLVLFLGACHRSNPNPPLPAGTQLGAATPAAAAGVVFAAAKDGDIQLLSTVWGDSLGSVRRTMDRTELEQRGYIMLRCLRHDKFSVVSEGPGLQGARVLAIQVANGPLTRSTNFTVVKGPQSRWYVYNFDIEPLNDICKVR
jgi:hypothetical protein